MVSEKSKVPKRRKFVYDTENFYDKEELGPCNAPNWTRTGYKGQLKSFIRNACNRRFGNELPTSPNNNTLPTSPNNNNTLPTSPNNINNQNKPGNRARPIQVTNEDLMPTYEL